MKNVPLFMKKIIVFLVFSLFIQTSEVYRSIILIQLIGSMMVLSACIFQSDLVQENSFNARF